MAKSKNNLTVIKDAKNIVVDIDGDEPDYTSVLSGDRSELYNRVAKFEKKLLDGMGEIQLLKTIMFELVAKLDTSEAGKWWKEARLALNDFQKAMKIGAYDPKRSAVEMEVALDKLELSLNGGNDYYATLDEIQKMAKVISNLREKEIKQITAKNNALTISIAQMWVNRIGEIIRDEVEDEPTKIRIAKRLREETWEVYGVIKKSQEAADG